MADHQPELTRRTALKRFGAIGLASSLCAGTVSATSKHTSQTVSVGLARQAAESQRTQLTTKDKFSAWHNATLGTPATFYKPTGRGEPQAYEPSAYVFPVTKQAETLGYITASARREWTPILEFSRATPPQQQIPTIQQAAKDNGRHPTDRLVYHGSLSYGLGLENGDAIGLHSRLTYSEYATAPRGEMQLDATNAATKWQALESGARTDGQTASTATTDAVTSSSVPIAVQISGCPGYDENYDGGNSDTKGDTSYPGYLGNEPDPWDDYDGCAPYAGANVVGYYENIDYDEWDRRNELIDRMHYNMNTGNDIYTNVSDIASGIADYDNGQYSYSASHQSSFAPLSLKSELADGRPGILTMWNGGSPKESSYDYGDHTVAVYGYDESYGSTGDLYWGVYDSFVSTQRWIVNNNWTDADGTYVNTVN